MSHLSDHHLLTSSLRPRLKITVECKFLMDHLYVKLQAEDGHWQGDHAGPLFLLPRLAIVYCIIGTLLSEEQKKEMIQYPRSLQCPDGGWG